MSSAILLRGPGSIYNARLASSPPGTSRDSFHLVQKTLGVCTSALLSEALEGLLCLLAQLHESHGKGSMGVSLAAAAGEAEQSMRREEPVKGFPRSPESCSALDFNLLK